MLHDNIVTFRIENKLQKTALRRAKEIKKERKVPISLSEYIRELIRTDGDKQIIC